MGGAYYTNRARPIILSSPVDGSVSASRFRFDAGGPTLTLKAFEDGHGSRRTSETIRRRFAEGALNDKMADN